MKPYLSEQLTSLYLPLLENMVPQYSESRWLFGSPSDHSLNPVSSSVSSDIQEGIVLVGNSQTAFICDNGDNILSLEMSVKADLGECIFSFFIRGEIFI